MREVTALLLVGLMASGCTGNASDDTAANARPRVPASSSPSKPTPRGVAEAGAADPGKPRRDVNSALVPTVVQASVRFSPEPGLNFVRSRDGSTLAVLGTGWPRERTWYRIFDRNWRPRTPVLQVKVTLEVLRGLKDSFVGLAYRGRFKGVSAVDQWVTIEPSGMLKPVDRSKPVSTLRVGDRLVERAGARPVAYRPSTGQVITPQLPAATARHSWSVGPNGSGCALPGGSRSAQPAYWSTDEGRSWRRLRLADVLPQDVRGGPIECQVRRGRMTLLTAGEYIQDLYTIDLPGRRLLATVPIRSNPLLNPYNSQVLPDGRRVFGTNRPGLMVATDTLNSRFEFRPGPVGLDEDFLTLGGDIVNLRNRPSNSEIDVSSDGGHTWREVDLRG